jgi:hypothetical protein
MFEGQHYQISIERQYAVRMLDKVENVLSHVDDASNVTATESTPSSLWCALYMTDGPLTGGARFLPGGPGPPGPPAGAGTGQSAP